MHHGSGLSPVPFGQGSEVTFSMDETREGPLTLIIMKSLFMEEREDDKA